MRRNSAIVLAYAVLLGAAGPLSAGLSGQFSSAAAQERQAQAYTDVQLSAFVAASAEVEPISSRIGQMSAQERTQATRQIQQILRRHRINGDVYNGIEAQARTDDALAQRIAALQVANISDDLLRRFTAAATEIDPISRSLNAEATAEQRTQAGVQIRAILDRYNLRAATYNAIAARAQTDQALAARIATLRTPAPPTSGSP